MPLQSGLKQLLFMNYFTKEEKIRFQHIDYAGIVFYPRFLEMLNALVEDWFEEALDRPFHLMHETNGIPTVDLKVQFKSPARLGETLTKHLWVKELRNSSMVCGFTFVNATQKTVLEGEVTLVNVKIAEDRQTISSEAFNESMKSKIELYLQ
jgi:4-hydroxybenzoyl-CoA thioesterase